eukprot:TRINITY_DN923_c0_g3_i2.p1 TRINITY_DN923_c0_g3~~TRINITY_DN923_c0_g3_i2.p1  ORF type:complete len:362 (-),score=52.53 TRINITY_DN923_c0_g3_i2:219-1304(-)
MENRLEKRMKEKGVGFKIKGPVTEEGPINFNNEGDIVDGSFIIGKDGLKHLDPVKKPVEQVVAANGPGYYPAKEFENLKLADLKSGAVLGQGSSGMVEKMYYEEKKIYVALKAIALDTHDETFKKRLKIELDTLMKCNSPYIVSCYAAFYEEAKIFIAMEYMDKGSLASILKEVKTIPEVILGYVTYQALKGLEYLHKTMKVIHRDIKPSNILVNSKGEVKIADFGVSGVIEFTHDFRTSFVGTVTYMSPERIRGEPYGSDTDLWSLGLSIFEMATGRFPYPDPDSGVQTLGFWDLVHYINTHPAPKLPSTFSKDICDFVSICLGKESGKRSSATELLKHPFVKKYEGKTIESFVGWLEFC